MVSSVDAQWPPGHCPWNTLPDSSLLCAQRPTQGAFVRVEQEAGGSSQRRPPSGIPPQRSAALGPGAAQGAQSPPIPGQQAWGEEPMCSDQAG